MNFEYIYWISHTHTSEYRETSKGRESERERETTFLICSIHQKICLLQSKRNKSRMSCCCLSISGSVCICGHQLNRACPLCNIIMIESNVSQMADTLPCPRSPSWVDLRQEFFFFALHSHSAAFCISLSHCSAWFIEKIAIEFIVNSRIFWRGRIIN